MGSSAENEKRRRIDLIFNFVIPLGTIATLVFSFWKYGNPQVRVFAEFALITAAFADIFQTLIIEQIINRINNRRNTRNQTTLLGIGFELVALIEAILGAVIVTLALMLFWPESVDVINPLAFWTLTTLTISIVLIDFVIRFIPARNPRRRLSLRLRFSDFRNSFRDVRKYWWSRQRYRLGKFLTLRNVSTVIFVILIAFLILSLPGIQIWFRSTESIPFTAQTTLANGNIVELGTGSLVLRRLRFDKRRAFDYCTGVHERSYS